MSRTLWLKDPLHYFLRVTDGANKTVGIPDAHFPGSTWTCK